MRTLAHLLLWFALPCAAATPCTDNPNALDFPRVRLERVAGGLTKPVDIQQPSTEPARLYVVEQAGTIRVIEHGAVRARPFLDIRARVASGGEMGLLGLAFHPDYARNGFFYVDYTSTRGGRHTVIARFRRNHDGSADPDSDRVLLTVEQTYENHKGGQLAFGPDGFLYIALGDGGSANDPHGNGQNLGSLLGKILRIDVDHAARDRAYAIPRDNPFAGTRGARPEIYAYGLRNPWRFSFDRATGRLYAADVGQDAREEIDVIAPGGNYGWNVMEGERCNTAVNATCDKRRFNAPILTYPHPEGFSVIGGYVYRGRRIPRLCGAYLYGDYVTQRLWALRYDGRRVTGRALLMSKVLHMSSFGQDGNGEVYLADLNGGAVYRLVEDR